MDILSKIKELLVKNLSGKGSAYLYGSRARGTAREDSDWDILIILDKEKLESSDYDDISYPLCEMGWDVDQIVNPILYTRKKWLAQWFTPFYKNVEHDKIVLL